MLTDLSTNGVYINGARQPTSRDSRTVLTDGDTFRIGEYSFGVDEVMAAPDARRIDDLPEDPLDIDPLADPLGRSPGPAFPHPLPSHSPTFRPIDPFDTAEAEAKRSTLSFDGTPEDPLDMSTHGLDGAQDYFNGAKPSEMWSGPAQGDNADAPRHALRLPRLLPPQNQATVDFDALIGDLSSLDPAGVHLAPPDDQRPHVTTRPPANSIRDPFAEFDDLIQPPAQLPTAPATPPTENTALAPPAAAPVTAAITATTHPAADSASALALLHAFLEAAGVPNAPVGADPLAAMRSAGQVFRALTEGIREVLMSRTAIKGELRIEQTMMRSANNNPLKFSFSPDDAVTALLSPLRAGYMTPLKAAQEACDDIKTHELAVMAGVQTALMGLLARFDPETLENRLTTGGLAAMLPAARKARLWDSFCDLHGTIVTEAEDDFQAVFGRAFAKAYKAQSKKD